MSLRRYDKHSERRTTAGMAAARQLTTSAIASTTSPITSRSASISSLASRPFCSYLQDHRIYHHYSTVIYGVHWKMLALTQTLTVIVSQNHNYNINCKIILHCTWQCQQMSCYCRQRIVQLWSGVPPMFTQANEAPTMTRHEPISNMPHCLAMKNIFCYLQDGPAYYSFICIMPLHCLSSSFVLLSDCVW